MKYNLSLTTASVLEVLTFDELQEHLRLDGNEEKTLVEAMISAATEIVEHELERSLLTQTWTLDLPCFPQGDIPLYMPKVQSVTSVEYYDTSNTQQTLVVDTDFHVYATTDEGLVYLVDGGSWDATYPRPDAVSVVYVAGWESADDVPNSIKSVIKLLVGSMYANRESFVNGTISQELAGRFVARMLDRWCITEKEPR